MKLRGLLVAAVGATAMFAPALAVAESSSENYILWAQAETGGGAFLTSEGYRAFSSVADLAGDAQGSEGFRAAVGFQALTEEPYLTFSVSPSAVTLAPNPLTVASVSTAMTTATVTTNADFGYILTATATVDLQNQDGDPIAAVADGSVTSGSEEWGVAVSGPDAAFGDDRSVSGVTRTLATRGVWTDGVATAVTFKAAISTVTDSGNYSGTVTFIATANF